MRHLLLVKEKWESLKKKYTTVLSTTGCKYFDDFIVYKKPDDIFILEVWQHLHKLKRKVAQTQPVVADAFKNKELLQRLFQSLPDKYNIIHNILKNQLYFDVDVTIRKLEDHEAKIKSTETANWTKENNKANQNYSRPQSPLSLECCRVKNEPKKLCLLCQKDH